MTLQDPANALPRIEECRVGLVALIFTVNLSTILICLCLETNHPNGKLFGQTFSQENISNDPSAIGGGAYAPALKEDRRFLRNGAPKARRV